MEEVIRKVVQGVGFNFDEKAVQKSPLDDFLHARN
jgi:hypothetical protein